MIKKMIVILFVVVFRTPPPRAPGEVNFIQKSVCVRFDDVGATAPRFETMSESDWFEFRESCDTSYAKTDCQKTKLWGPTFGTYCRECDE